MPINKHYVLDRKDSRMDFPWYNPFVRSRAKKEQCETFYKMQVNSLVRHAQILKNLQYSKERTIAILKARVAWEFELERSTPEIVKDVKSIVDTCYSK